MINLFHKARMWNYNSFILRYYAINMETTEYSNRAASKYNYIAYFTKDGLFLLPEVS